MMRRRGSLDTDMPTECALIVMKDSEKRAK